MFSLEINEISRISQDQTEHAYCHSFEFLRDILCQFHLLISKITERNIRRGIFRALSNIYDAVFGGNS